MSLHELGIGIVRRSARAGRGRVIKGQAIHKQVQIGRGHDRGVGDLQSRADFGHSRCNGRGGIAVVRQADLQFLGSIEIP